MQDLGQSRATGSGWTEGLTSAVRYLTPLLMFSLISAAVPKVPVAVADDVLKDYTSWLNGRDVLSVTAFGGPGTRRDVVEVALFQQALAQGGWSESISLIGVPSYARLQEELRTGHVAASANTLWRSDLLLLDGVAVSHPLIPVGEFEAGIYTTSANAAAYSVTDREGVRQLRFVSSKTWTADWRTLEALAPVQIDDVATWEAMVRMVVDQRVDAVLAPFQSTEDLSMQAYGATLVPIPGLKIGLTGSRHFAVAGRHHDGARLMECLNRGLLLLKANEVIRQAYRESGFLNPKTDDWQLITVDVAVEPSAP
jgi:hypothetical protein